MNGQDPNKPAEKGSPKTSTVKTPVDPEKAINQIRQEIKTLTKTVKGMQQKPDTHMVIVPVPSKLISKANAYLVEIERSVGLTWSLSTLMCQALDVYLWAEEDNKRIEGERDRAERAGSDKQKAGD